MALDESVNDAALLGELYGEGAFCFNNKKSDSVPSDDSEDSNFDCNICLDSAQEPVVTLCGHLFCWPCIHKWLDIHSHRDCPVCKSQMSHSTLVPLYGRGRTTHEIVKTKSTLPRRPEGPVYRFEMPTSPNDMRLSERVSRVLSSNGLSYSAALDPMMVMIGEMVATGLFGTRVMDRFGYPDTYNMAGISEPRMTRRIMQAEKSLTRRFFFLLCCVALCLFLF